MLGVPLEALGLVLGVPLHLAREILGVLLRALGGVLRVAAGVLGRALRLPGQLGRLPLLTRDLLLRLAAQALLKLPLMAQLLLCGVLLAPLLMRGGVLLMPLEQLGLMLGAALSAFGALALDAGAQLLPAGVDARGTRGVVGVEVVVEVVAALAHVLDQLGIVLLDAVDEAVALDLTSSSEFSSSSASSSVCPSRCSSTSSASMLPKWKSSLRKCSSMARRARTSSVVRMRASMSWTLRSICTSASAP